MWLFHGGKGGGEGLADGRMLWEVTCGRGAFPGLAELPRAAPAAELAQGRCRGNSDPGTSQGQVLQPGRTALQPRPAGTGRILTRGMLWVSWLPPPSLLSFKARFCSVTPQPWVLCHNGILWDFSSFPFHFRDKGSFSQLLSCRCSIGNSNSSRDFQGIFSGFVLSPATESYLVLNSSGFCTLAQVTQIHINSGSHLALGFQNSAASAQLTRGGKANTWLRDAVKLSVPEIISMLGK